MTGIIVTKKLITDIETIAGYFDEDSNAILQNLVANELGRIMPLLRAKQAFANSAKQPNIEQMLRVKTSGELEKSKPMEGEFAGVKLWERNWRAVTFQILKILCDNNYIKHDELTTLLPSIANINIARGVRDDSGYIPMPELGISVQGLSAPRVGEFIQKIAEHYKIPFNFKLRWNGSDSSDMGGQTGIFASDS